MYQNQMNLQYYMLNLLILFITEHSEPEAYQAFEENSSHILRVLNNRTLRPGLSMLK